MSGGGRVAWVSLEGFGDEADRWIRGYCQAPRHVGAFVPAAWIAAIVVDGCEPIVQAMCSDCMETIARDLGMTAAEGAL